MVHCQLSVLVFSLDVCGFDNGIARYRSLGYISYLAISRLSLGVYRQLESIMSGGAGAAHDGGAAFGPSLFSMTMSTSWSLVSFCAKNALKFKR